MTELTGQWPRLTDPLTLPELEPILNAIKRGTRRSRLRILQIVCQNGDQLGEVFPTAAGPVLVGFGRVELRGQQPRSGVGAIRLGNVDPITDGRFLLLQCQCSRMVLPANWITGKLASGTRRAVWETRVPRRRGRPHA
jgi:hypothetical protein